MSASAGRVSRLAPLGAVLLLLGLALVGCGGDDGAAAEPSEPASSSSTPEPATSEPATSEPTTSEPTTSEPTTPEPTTSEPTTSEPTSSEPPETASPTPSEPATPEPSPESPYDRARAEIDAAGPPTAVRRLETPSGIYCVLQSGFARGCELPQGSGIAAPEECGSDGPTQNVGRVEFRSRGVVAVCNTDTIRGARPTSLDAGSVGASSATGLSCLVEDDGVLCVDSGRRAGFRLTLDAYSVF